MPKTMCTKSTQRRCCTCAREMSAFESFWREKVCFLGETVHVVIVIAVTMCYVLIMRACSGGKQQRRVRPEWCQKMRQRINCNVNHWNNSHCGRRYRCCCRLRQYVILQIPVLRQMLPGP